MPRRSLLPKWKAAIVFGVAAATAVVNYALSLFERGERSGGESVEGVRTVVAYSLLKEMEMDGERVDCGRTVKRDEKVETWGNWTRVPETDVYVYSVFFDDRLEPFYYFRVIAMVKGTTPPQLYCHTKPYPSSKNHTTTKAKITKIWLWTETENTYSGVLYSCQVLTRSIQEVTLSADPCVINVAASFRVSGESQESRGNGTTVCVKPLIFPDVDVSERMLHWIVINKVLGATSIYLYISTLHPNVTKLLKFLTQTDDSIKLQHFEYLPHSESLRTNDSIERLNQKRRNEVLPYNDCFYRNLKTSKYVLPIDFDEVVVPRVGKRWEKILKKLETSKTAASYTVMNGYFLEDFRNEETKIPVFFERIVRQPLTKEFGKSFVSTNEALILFNHFALASLRPGVPNNVFVPPNLQVNHYRDRCDNLSNQELEQCYLISNTSRTVVDPVIFKFRRKFYAELNRISIEYKKYLETYIDD